MTREELVKKYHEGDDFAFTILVKSLHPLLRKIALSMRCNAVREPNELYAEGCIGIRKAADKFDLTLGKPFLPYVTAAIKNAMRDYIRKELRTAEWKLIKQGMQVVSTDQIAEAEAKEEIVFEGDPVEPPDAKSDHIDSIRISEIPYDIGNLHRLEKRYYEFLDYHYGLLRGSKAHDLTATAEHWKISISRATDILYESLCQTYDGPENLMTIAEQFASIHPEIPGETLADKLWGIPVELRRKLGEIYEAYKGKKSGMESEKGAVEPPENETAKSA